LKVSPLLSSRFFLLSLSGLWQIMIISLLKWHFFEFPERFVHPWSR